MGNRKVIVQILIDGQYEQPEIGQDDFKLRTKVFPCRYGVIITLIENGEYRIKYLKGEIEEKNNDKQAQHNAGDQHAPVFKIDPPWIGSYKAELVQDNGKWQCEKRFLWSAFPGRRSEGTPRYKKLNAPSFMAGLAKPATDIQNQR